MTKRLLLLLCLLPGIALSQQFSDYQYRANEAASLANTVIPGGWTLYRTDLSRDEMTVFNRALDGLVGVGYTPFAVSTQVVAGTNYKFICNAQPTYPDAAPYAVVIKVYQSLDGELELLSITDISE
ncbi:hypothetical protein [Spartinivicinus ruber]|uniref:hypothetical protein n=1 Tax=Spartinivicinus ruber TaxID=2683272 RepID=UPI001CA42328|nr:hypothetical protein [Spartinivicinus ruber]